MTSSTSPTLAAEIEDSTGINPATCYQCGKCSAGCPMASETRLRPHDVMRLVSLDRSGPSRTSRSGSASRARPAGRAAPTAATRRASSTRCAASPPARPRARCLPASPRSIGRSSSRCGGTAACSSWGWCSGTSCGPGPWCRTRPPRPPSSAAASSAPCPPDPRREEVARIFERCVNPEHGHRRRGRTPGGGRAGQTARSSATSRAARSTAPPASSTRACSR